MRLTLTQARSRARSMAAAAMAAAPPGRPAVGLRGSVLISVLVIVALVAAILAAFIDEAVDKIKYYGLFYHRDDLRKVAYSNFELTLAVINEIIQIDGSLNSPNQGWRTERDIYEYAQMVLPGRLGEDGEERVFEEGEDGEEAGPPPGALKVQIRVEDESGKFPLNNMSSEILTMLWEEMEIDLRDAEVLTDSLLDWLDEDADLERINGAEKDHYDDNDPPYLASNSAIQSLDEIRLIRGFDELFFDEETGAPNENFNLFRSAVSLYNTGKVNLHAANPLVLATIARLEGFEPTVLHDYIIGLDGERNTLDDRLLTDPDSPYTPGGSEYSDSQTNVLRISITVTRGEASFLYTALVQTGGAATTGSGTAGRTSNNATRTSSRTRTGALRAGTATRTGTTQQEDAGQALQYPFTIVRASENWKI